MEGVQKSGASVERINARLMSRIPKLLPKITENASVGRRPPDSGATKRVGNLARNIPGIRIEGGKKTGASERINTKLMGCRPKVLPKIAEKASVGRQPRDSGATKRVGNLAGNPPGIRMEGAKKSGAYEERINARLMSGIPKVLPKIRENASVGRQPQDSGATKRVAQAKIYRRRYDYNGHRVYENAGDKGS